MEWNPHLTHAHIFAYTVSVLFFFIILTINISVLLHCTIAITIIITNGVKFLLLPAYLNFLYCIHAAVHFIL